MYDATCSGRDGAIVDDSFLSSVNSSGCRNPSTRLSLLQVEAASIQKSLSGFKYHEVQILSVSSSLST